MRSAVKKEIIAIGGFFKTGQPNIAEIAFTVHKDWRGNGITKYLLNYLIMIARELNYKAFGGNVLLENKAMLHIINNTEYPLKYKQIESGVFDFIMDITKT